MSKKRQSGWLGRMAEVIGIDSAPQGTEPLYPYLKRRDFLTATEVAFYHALCQAAGEGVRVLAKVRLGDLFFPKTGDPAENRRHYGRIASKYVDFLVCDRWEIRPLLGVEIDHGSDQRPEQLERDRFVTKVFRAANLPLMRVAADADFDVHVLSIALREHATIPGPGDGPSSQQAAEDDEVGAEALAESWVPNSPSCPQCGRPMVLRTVKKAGPNKGKQYWACFAYPECRGVLEYKPEA